MSSADLDATDRMILDLLREDGRRTVRDIAARAKLSPSPVRRRIDRLERLGIIRGYTAIVDENRLSESMEAFAELRFTGNASVEAITRSARSIPEVIGVYTVAGDPDALVHFRVTSLTDLHRIIDLIRTDGNVVGTKTLMVLDSWRPGESPPSDGPPGR